MRDLCRAHSLRLFVEDFDTASYAREKGVSIEMAAREQRYAYFEKLRSELRFDKIAVAHHRDDNVETMEKLPSCAAYTDFLLRVAREEGAPEILAAALPCMLGYRYVFEELLRRYPAAAQGPYAPLMRDYTSPGYAAACAQWTDFADALCSPLPP